MALGELIRHASLKEENKKFSAFVVQLTLMKRDRNKNGCCLSPTVFDNKVAYSTISSMLSKLTNKNFIKILA